MIFSNSSSSSGNDSSFKEQVSRVPLFMICLIMLVIYVISKYFSLSSLSSSFSNLRKLDLIECNRLSNSLSLLTNAQNSVDRSIESRLNKYFEKKDLYLGNGLSRISVSRNIILLLVFRGSGMMSKRKNTSFPRIFFTLAICST